MRAEMKVRSNNAKKYPRTPGKSVVDARSSSSFMLPEQRHSRPLDATTTFFHNIQPLSSPHECPSSVRTPVVFARVSTSSSHQMRRRIMSIAMNDHHQHELLNLFAG